MEFTFTPKDTNPVYLDSTLLTPGIVTLPNNYTEYASVVVMINDGILKPVSTTPLSSEVDNDIEPTPKKARTRKVATDAE